MKPDSREKSSLKLFLFFIAALGLVAFGVALAFYFSVFSGSMPAKHDVWGAFGDFLGGTLNPILSFLALIALLYTIHIQVKELRIANEELKESRQVFQAQEETSRRAAEENTFFKLMDHMTQLTTTISMKFGVNAPHKTGREVFSAFAQTLDQHLQPQLERNQAIDNVDEKISALSEIYKDLHKRHFQDNGHYYPFLASYIAFVDQSHLENKPFYYELILNQMTLDEIYLLGCFAVFTKTDENQFKSLIEKYSFFAPLAANLIDGREYLAEFFAESAFSSN